MQVVPGISCVILVIHDCFQDWHGQLSVNLSSALPVENKKNCETLFSKVVVVSFTKKKTGNEFNTQIGALSVIEEWQYKIPLDYNDARVLLY